MVLNATAAQHIFLWLHKQSGWHYLTSSDSKMSWSLLLAALPSSCTRRHEQRSVQVTAPTLISSWPSNSWAESDVSCHPPGHKLSGTGTGWLTVISPGICWQRINAELKSHCFADPQGSYGVFLLVLTLPTDLQLIFIPVCLFHLHGHAPHAILQVGPGSQPSLSWTPNPPSTLLPLSSLLFLSVSLPMYSCSLLPLIHLLAQEFPAPT